MPIAGGAWRAHWQKSGNLDLICFAWRKSFQKHVCVKQQLLFVWDIPYRLQGGMCIDQMQEYIAQGGNTKAGYAKKSPNPIWTSKQCWTMDPM
jgi:hypothetical protein